MPGDAHASAAAIAELFSRSERAPWLFSFLGLMRHIGARSAAIPRIGFAARPQQEPFRLGQKAALTFAPREIAEVVMPSNGESTQGEAQPAQRSGNNLSVPVIRLYGLGVLGPNGPMPLHCTEIIHERLAHHRDGTLADFLDLFHHRYLTLFYRAWAQGQAAAGLDRPGEEVFSAYVARLTGNEPDEIRHSALPDHARMAASAHLCRDARHPDGLAATLAHFFSMPVRLEEFVMHWIRIDDRDRCCLGRPGSASVMGIGAMAGEVVPDRQSKFRLMLGPLSLEQYLRFTPQGRDLPLLVEVVRAFVGLEFVWDVELRLRSEDTPPASLEDGQKLGWSTWLGRSQVNNDRCAALDTRHAVGMVFEPERYLQGTAQAAAVT